MNADVGSLDTIFHGTGQVLLPTTVAGVSVTGCQAVAVQPDGKIGRAVGVQVQRPVLRRGTAERERLGGHVVRHQRRLLAVGVLAQVTPRPRRWTRCPLPDGSLIVGGGAKATDGYQGFAAVKVTAAGRTDTSYGTGGLKVVHVGTAANPRRAPRLEPAR
ncbi:MAG: hypothetical protein U0797_27910 [Gemmataceae bacterium]